jgi:hypothetical protein
MEAHLHRDVPTGGAAGAAPLAPISSMEVEGEDRTHWQESIHRQPVNVFVFSNLTVYYRSITVRSSGT